MFLLLITTPGWLTELPGRCVSTAKKITEADIMKMKKEELKEVITKNGWISYYKSVSNFPLPSCEADTQSGPQCASPDTPPTTITSLFYLYLFIMHC